MSNGKSQGLKSRLKLIVFSLLPALLLFVIAEVVTDSIIRRTPETLTNPTTGLTHYTMKIGQLPWSPRSVTPLNSLGFPDEEFVNLGTKGDCLHVVFSGDSFTFGDSVDRGKNYVSLVKRLTALRYPDRCIRFFNIAERMTTIEQQAKRIRETLDLLRPDVVILGQYQNDLTDLTMPGSAAYIPPTAGHETNFWGDVLRTSIPGYTNSIVRFLTYRTFGFLIQNGVKYEAPLVHWSIIADTRRAEEAARLMGIYDGMYASLLQELRAKGIGFGVVILPSKLDVLAKRYPEGEYFEALARKHGVPHVSLLPVLDREREEYSFQMYDGHMSEFGNEVVAMAVLEWLYESEPAPFPRLRASTSLTGVRVRHTDAGAASPRREARAAPGRREPTG